MGNITGDHWTRENLHVGCQEKKKNPPKHTEYPRAMGLGLVPVVVTVKQQGMLTHFVVGREVHHFIKASDYQSGCCVCTTPKGWQMPHTSKGKNNVKSSQDTLATHSPASQAPGKLPNVLAGLLTTCMDNDQLFGGLAHHVRKHRMELPVGGVGCCCHAT